MPTISKTFEKTTKAGFHYLIDINADLNEGEKPNEVPYENFKANLYINGSFIANIAPVLSKMDSFDNILDEDWSESFK